MRKPLKKLSRRTVLKLGATGLVAGTGIGIASSRMERTERTLRLPNWKAGAMRVAHVSDVHLINARQVASAQQAVRAVIAAKPDLFVLTGDFLNYDQTFSHEAILRVFSELSDLKCPCYGVLGNHDYMSGAPGKVAETLAKTPLRLLVNQAVDVSGVRLVGLDDALWSQPDYSLVRARDASSTLVLLHEPDFVSEVHCARLVLSGHSHGGEICLPGGISLYTPTGARRYTSGFYPEATSPLYVNRGTATLGPARIYCPTEVAILTLQSA